jgi:hypothetical protein
MKSLQSFKNKFGASIISNKQSNFIKGGTDYPTLDPNDPNYVDPNADTTDLLGEPWDKRGPRPGTKGK